MVQAAKMSAPSSAFDTYFPLQSFVGAQPHHMSLCPGEIHKRLTISEKTCASRGPPIWSPQTRDQLQNRSNDLARRLSSVVSVLVSFAYVRDRSESRRSPAPPQVRTVLISPGPPDEHLESVLAMLIFSAA